MHKLSVFLILLAVLLFAVSCSGKGGEAGSGDADGTADVTNDAGETADDTAGNLPFDPAENPADDPAADPASPAETPSASGWAGYTVIRPDFGVSDTLISAAVELRKALAAGGAEIDLSTDYVGRNEELPTSGKEILVGLTTRALSETAAAGLRLRDWRIKADGSGFVAVAGGSEEAVKNACLWLAQNCPDGPEQLPEDGFEHLENYQIENITVFGNPLGEYSLSGADGSRRAVALMQKKAAELAGLSLSAEKKGGRVISLMQDENVDGWKVDCTGGMMVISGSDDAQLCAAVSSIFDEAASGGETAWDYTFAPTGKAVYEQLTQSVTDKAGLEAAIKIAEDSAEAGKLYHITINLAPGEYALKKPIELTEETLGFSTIAFKGQGNAVISGALKLSGAAFSETRLNGTAVYSAPLPPELSAEGGAAYRDVFIGTDIMSAVRLTRPEYPYDGSFLTCVPEGPTEYSEGSSVIHSSTPLDDIGDITGVQMRMYNYWDDDRLSVKNIDYPKNEITLGGETGFSLYSGHGSGGAKFRFENVKSGLRNPGQAYIDRKENLIYVIPPAGQSLSALSVWIGGIERLVTIDGVTSTADSASVSFENVSFAASGWDIDNRSPNQAATDLPSSAVSIKNSSGVSFLSCRFKGVGYTALHAEKAVSGLAVQNCDFYDLGAGAIHLGGENERTGCIENAVIKGNIIDGYGRVFANGIGVLMRYCLNCEVSNNDIHDGFYSGISCGWSWGYNDTVTDGNKIKDNRISNLGQGLLSDLGGIYTLGVQKNTVLSGNVISGVNAATYGGWGIYLDEGSTGITVRDNLCYDFSDEAFHQHYGRENMIVNNIFAFGRRAGFAITRAEDHISLYLDSNIIVTNGAPLMNANPNERRFADTHNLFYDYAGKNLFGSISFGRAQNTGHFGDSLISDPLFFDAENRDFTLNLNSPALALGFKPTDYSQVGSCRRIGGG
jgi:hypothetical protein